MTAQGRGSVGTVALLPGKWRFKDTAVLGYPVEAESVASKMEDEGPEFS